MSIILRTAAYAALAAALLGARLPAAVASDPAPAAHAPAAWKDIDGRTYEGAGIARDKATVFIFATTQCPVSNLYMRRVAELANAYKDRGVRFFL
ncbi:MAG TPA: hypothetical protein VKT77_13445, partial [Chthonomonadaceae bacterium]|nr:hypothetical protein [Chthonomonadaceae bacterium]